jgi:hypothetical protein
MYDKRRKRAYDICGIEPFQGGSPAPFKPLGWGASLAPTLPISGSDTLLIALSSPLG